MMEQKLIPFDLTRALKGDKVITRGGDEVDELYHFKKDDSSNPLAIFIKGRGIFWHSIDGMYMESTPHALDLFMKPKECDYWVATGKGISGDILTTRAQQSEKQALDAFSLQYIGSDIQTHKITRKE